MTITIDAVFLFIGQVTVTILLLALLWQIFVWGITIELNSQMIPHRVREHNRRISELENKVVILERKDKRGV